MYVVRHVSESGKTIAVFKENLNQADWYLCQELRGRVSRSEILRGKDDRSLGLIFYGAHQKVLGLAMEISTDFPEQQSMLETLTSGLSGTL